MKNNILKALKSINNIKSIDGIKAGIVAEFLILSIIFLLPLYFNYFTVSSIDFSKMVAFRILLLLLLFFSIWRFSFKKITFFKDRLIRAAFPLAVFFLSLVISLVFSVNFNNSLFGSYERSEGLISFLLYGLWLILLIFNLGDIFQNNKKLKRLSITICISASLVSLYALFQLFGLDLFTWSEPAHITKRAFSSFGQPNYLACWLVMVMPISAYLVYISKALKGRIFYSFLFLLQLAALFSTGSRSAFLGFLIISGVWSIFLLLRSKNILKKKLLVILGSFVCLIILFVVSLSFFNPSRLTELANLKSGSSGIRIELWQKGFKAFLKKPLFGYGLENQKEVYVRYYQIDWALYSRPNTYSDRAHNIILDILLTSGIVGLAAFIYLIYKVFSNLWHSYRDNNNYFSLFLLWAIGNYLFTLLFNFSITVTDIYFFLFVALAFLTSGEMLREDNQEHAKPISYTIVIASLLVLFYGIILQIKMLQADYYFNKSLRALLDQQYFSALVLNDYMMETQPNKVMQSYYGREVSLRLIEGLPFLLDRSSHYAVNKYLINFAEDVKSNDFDSRFAKAFILGVTGSRVTSEEMFSELALISPYLPKIYLAWGDVYLLNNNPEKAKLKFEKAKSLLPSVYNTELNNDHLKQLKYYYSLIDARLSAAALRIKK